MTVTITGPSGREYKVFTRDVVFSTSVWSSAAPTFHRPQWDATACARPFQDSDLRFPPRHAVKFGRPCKRCWP